MGQIMMTSDLLITLIVLVPVLAVPGIVLFHRLPNLREAVSLLAAALLTGLVVELYQRLEAGATLAAQWWEVLPGLTIAFSIEPLGMMFALIASSLWFVTVVYAIGYMRGHEEQNQTRFYACFAVAIAAVMGVALAENLFTLFVFYEVLSLCTYPLVTHAGTEKAKQGGRVYLGILLSTSIAFFLPAIILTWMESGSLSFSPGGVFDSDTSVGLLSVLLVLFAFGVGKAALMPFHRWLPSAMVAPTPVSALLHAVAVVKAGVFTVVKVVVFIFGIDTVRALPVSEYLVYLASASILLASVVAMRQDNIKARLAYSTISQLAYITLGAFIATATGVLGSALHIAMHAAGKITLFFCAGAIYVAAHKTLVSELDGLGRKMPYTFAAFTIAALSIIGLPPSGGTWSKWMLMLGAVDAGLIFVLAVLALSSLLNIVYLLELPARAFLRSPSPVAEQHHGGEAPWPSLLALCVTALACLVLFFSAGPIKQFLEGVSLT